MNLHPTPDPPEMAVDEITPLSDKDSTPIDTEPPPKKFVFVSDLGGERKDKRVRSHIQSHIQRENVRRRKLRKLEEARLAIAVTVNRPDASRRISDISEVSNVDVSTEGEVVSKEGTPALDGPIEEVCAPQAVVATPPVSWATRQLSALDPFFNFPVHLDPVAQYVVAISPDILQVLDPSVSYRWIDAVGLPVAFKLETVLYMLLSTSGGILDGLRGEGPSADTVRFQNTALRSMAKLINDPATRFNDEVFAAVTCLLLPLDVSGEAGENVHVHSRAWARISRNRGGLKSLESADLEVDRYITFLSIFGSKGQISYLDRLDGPDMFEDVEDWKREVNFFIRVLLALMSWQDVSLPKVTDMASWQPAEGYFPRAALYCVANPQNEVERAYQMFTACYLSVALWESKDHPKTRQALLQTFRAKFKKLGGQITLTNIIWILVDGIDGKRERKWQALRMIKVMHRLTVPTMSLVTLFLSGLLDPEVPPTELVKLTQGDLDIIGEEAVAGLPIL
jgi:hypothetical protein